MQNIYHTGKDAFILTKSIINYSEYKSNKIINITKNYEKFKLEFIYSYTKEANLTVKVFINNYFFQVNKKGSDMYALIDKVSNLILRKIVEKNSKFLSKKRKKILRYKENMKKIRQNEIFNIY